MAPRTKRRRLTDLSDDPSDSEIYKPVTPVEREKWNGFCEIESEPALFNVMLREFGVQGVKVQEVISLDEEMMAFLNKPIYGLIFLFRWREDDAHKQEASCPDGIWFANQTASNACASVALLNIVNNIPDIDLGEHLRHFKDFTMPFTPALRGDAINNFEFVKRVHNSFARKMDILNSDLQLQVESRSRKKASSNQDGDDDDSSFHFIAFMPALGQVWKFDGLERQPESIGQCSEDDWLDVVRPNLLDRMAAYEEDQIEFSILGLVRDPLHDLIHELAMNVKGLEIIHARVPPESTGTAASSFLEGTILGPEPSLGLTQTVLDAMTVPEKTRAEYQDCAKNQLDAKRRALCEAQRELRSRVREEQQSQRADDDYATGRRFDYGPAVRAWLQFLARKQVLPDLLE
ncbi:Ubiquitin carboxyl-terminal hydrolase [Penicillium ucsense]|uniref:Ubiquitin carboxyl-terminal hydrolase n=1 Tax=Penicillium ucsense TaxID=2839758 RepID=A0A8J8W0I4_9EURO|nr:Ubiquitin carboxyl-terminal hydrolase [Penicillium ucsense]KAF7734785.1 Ubiquitin carboxyl-terminal hydrolase [Penicillium ucsense]